MSDLSENIYELQTLGFTIVKNVIGPELMAELKEELKVALADDNERFGKYKGKNPDLALDLTIHNPMFMKLIDNDKIMEMFYAILDKTCTLYSFTSTILKPNEEAYVHKMHVDTYKYTPNFFTGLLMTIPLEDFTDANGATLYLPGSQHSEQEPSAETFARYAISTTRKAGDALFFNPRVWHKAGNNTTDNVRSGLTVYATRAWIKQRFDFPRMIPKESLEGMSDRLINFLGFNACPPESMDDFFEPKIKRQLIEAK